MLSGSLSEPLFDALCRDIWSVQTYIWAREILQFELLRIWEMRPVAMLFVTHSIEEAVLMGDRVVVLKGRPSSVFETVAVDLPRPRDRGTLGLPRFNELREHVWSTLMDEARRAEIGRASWRERVYI